MINFEKVDLLISPDLCVCVCMCLTMCLQNYCVRGLGLFSSYLFQDVLELYDWNLTGEIRKLEVILRANLILFYLI